MQSGAPIPAGDVARGQPQYDALVAATGCAGSADTLACLRRVPYADFNALKLPPGTAHEKDFILLADIFPYAVCSVFIVLTPAQDRVA